MAEKRKTIRFQSEGGTYVALGTNFTKVGRLIDISTGGLAFRYIDVNKDDAQDSTTVAVFSSKIEFYLPDLACRLIYDSSIKEFNLAEYFKKSLRINRCGIQFTALDENQSDQLDFFIRHHTCPLSLL